MVAYDDAFLVIQAAVIKWEGTEDTPGYKHAMRMFIHYAESVSVAFKTKKPTSPQLFRCVVSTPKGSLNDRRKAGCAEDVTDIILEITGKTKQPHDRSRVWTIFHDVPDGDWAAGS